MDFKWGCRAANPLAAVAVCGGGKVPGRDESLPYGRTVDGSLTEGSGGVKTPPYDVTYKGAQSETGS